MKPARILIVDDEEDLRRLINLTLSHDGHDVDEAIDGADALRKLRAQPRDLVVLDLRMPVMNGHELLRHIRSDPNLRGIAVMVLSGHAEQEDLELGLELGADEYLVKPVRNWELRARVKSILRQHALRVRLGALEGSQAAATLREIARFLEEELEATTDHGRQADLHALSARTRDLLELFEKNLQTS